MHPHGPKADPRPIEARPWQVVGVAQDEAEETANHVLGISSLIRARRYSHCSGVTLLNT